MSLVKIENVEKSEPTLESAPRAKRRRRDINLLVEIKILRFDTEFLLAILAIPQLNTVPTHSLYSRFKR